MKEVKAPALRYHGGKFRLAPWVMSFFPEHTCYVESFGGAAGVLLQKPRSYAEVYNDLDGNIVNFFRVIQDPATRRQLTDRIVSTPYARDEFDLAWEPTDEPIEQARRTAIRAQMGFGSAGATKGKTGFRIDTKREYGTAQHLWAEYPESIAAVGERFSGVLIENRPAIDVMRQHDGEATMHFVDPPYMHETRCILPGRTNYRHELTNADHAELLEALLGLQGFVVLSGYHHPLYDEVLTGWRKFTTESRIAANRGCATRTECVWINSQCAAALDEVRYQRELAIPQRALFA
jgi:DNA adenine methylase